MKQKEEGGKIGKGREGGRCEIKKRDIDKRVS